MQLEPKQHDGALISVIIPIYNVEKYLRQCLDSVVNQTYKNLEIILIDDGSPDNYGHICDEYAAMDKRIVVIHKKNGGLCAARNDGMDCANGDWIAFVDSDDWCEIDYYEKLLSAADEQRADMICSGGCIVEHERKRIIKRGFRQQVSLHGREEMVLLMEKALIPHVGKDADEPGYQHNNAAPWDKLYRKEFIDRCQLRFDLSSKAWEDIWFNYQAFHEANIVVGCGDIGYHYRVVPTSITKGFNPNKSQINYRFVEKLLAFAKQNQLGTKMEDVIECYGFSMMSNALQCCYFHPANNKPYFEIVRDVNEMKTWSIYKSAIQDHRKLYLSNKQLLLKFLLKLPIVWPLNVAVMGRRFWKVLPVKRGGVIADNYYPSIGIVGCASCA